MSCRPTISRAGSETSGFLRSGLRCARPARVRRTRRHRRPVRAGHARRRSRLTSSATRWRLDLGAGSGTRRFRRGSTCARSTSIADERVQLTTEDDAPCVPPAPVIAAIRRARRLRCNDTLYEADRRGTPPYPAWDTGCRCSTSRHGHAVRLCRGRGASCWITLAGDAARAERLAQAEGYYDARARGLRRRPCGREPKPAEAGRALPEARARLRARLDAAALARDSRLRRRMPARSGAIIDLGAGVGHQFAPNSAADEPWRCSAKARRSRTSRR